MVFVMGVESSKRTKQLVEAGKWAGGQRWRKTMSALAIGGLTTGQN
jgi:hypothetical protein